jgi:HSP20 family protein
MTDGQQRSPHFRGLFDTFAELGRMREQAFHPTDSPSETAAHGIAWIPRTDIFARGDDVVIRCELAGVTPDDVELSLTANRLLIWGERTGAPDEEARSFYVRERRFGSFRRVIDLPEGIERSDISATFEDGLLEVRIADAATAPEPERIDIKAAAHGPVDLTSREAAP